MTRRASGTRLPDVPKPTHRYQSPDEDSGRWEHFRFRTGDIVISTRSKSGTTWLQMICALLIFGTPELPRPLTELSPWFDWVGTPRDELIDVLEAQTHRRFIKTHTPLDGLPIRPEVTYLVVARQPLDAAVSLYHQSANLDRQRIAELTGQPDSYSPARPPLEEWLRSWIDHDCDPQQNLDSLPGVLWHLSDAWRRRDADNVLLLHYADLSTDLEGQMRRLADALAIRVPAGRWPELVAAATFEPMKSRAEMLAPDPGGVLIDRRAFFRQGRHGSASVVLSPTEMGRYRARVAELAPADLIAWLHR